MSVAFKSENDIGYVEFDLADSKVNLLTAEVLKRLDEILDKIKIDTSVKAVVLKSNKENVFIAGADIKEIDDITKSDEGLSKAKSGQDILNKIEDLSVPTIALVDGVALGGGCELALACRYRVGTFNEKLKIGLPEVNLGIIPGFGGTYRLPRVVGLTEGLKMIVSGKPIDSRKAVRIGLFDRLYPQVGLDNHVKNFIEEIEAGSVQRKKKKGLKAFQDENRLGQMIVFSKTHESIMKTTKGFYPAPLRALATVKRNFYMNREQGLQLEAKEFSRLVVTAVSKNLVNLFYMSEKFKKLTPPGTENVVAKHIKKSAVVGAGVMGGGIAQLLSSRDIWVRMKDINLQALALGYGAASKVYQSAVKKRKFKQHEVDNKMAHISSTLDYSGFANADLVIEAVIENMDVKKKVFKELSEVVRSDTILCTNTSALSVTEMAKETKDPSKVIGLHFFNPVHRMPLIEVIKTDVTSNETIATTVNFVKRLGKTPILVKDSCGFLVNRVLLGYINEAGRILQEGATIQQIDHLMLDFGMPMGPFALTDEVGIDVGQKVLKILEEGLGERFKPVDIFDKVYEEGLLGKKAGKGFYVHGQPRSINPEIEKLITHGDKTEKNLDEWENRMIFIMINEAARCLEEGVVDDEDAVDIGMIMGTGFPAFRGGLMRYAHKIGIANVVEMLQLFDTRFGPDRFKPCQYLIDLKNKEQSKANV